MTLDFEALKPAARYKLLSATVIPRPVAWVTTIGATGVVNAAPYSFFNVFSEEPPLLVLGLQHREGMPKDTTANINRSREFVVNIATVDLAESLVATAAFYAPEEGEPEALGLPLPPSTKVAPPRLAEAPVAFECRHVTSLTFGERRELAVGQVVAMHARDGLVDPETLRVDWGGDYPLARLFAERYGRVQEIPPLPIPQPKAPAATSGDAS